MATKKETGEFKTVVVTDIDPKTGECYADTAENRAAGKVRDEQQPLLNRTTVKQ